MERRVREKSLIHLILADPEKGIPIAVDLYGGTVKAVCASVLKGYAQEDVEEAWGETFYRLWKYADSFDFEKNTSLKTYIGTIARNVSIDKRRSGLAVYENTSRLDEEEEMPDRIFGASDDDTERDVLRRMNAESVWVALGELDELTQSVFALRYGCGLAVKEIAGRIGVSAKQVENTLFRKKEVLRAMLADKGIKSQEDL
jgi:RNA polymerase sigma-70 factor (ECF subfamily)